MNRVRKLAMVALGTLAATLAFQIQAQTANPLEARNVVAAPSSEWPTYNNSYNGQRFSQAAQITRDNAKSLNEVCEAKLGDAGSFHSGLVLVRDILYVTTAHTTVALDARDCSIRWRHLYKAAQEEVYPVNRGVAYLDGKIFRGTPDGRVFALDAQTGQQLWLVKAGDPTKGEFFSSAPIAWRGLVFIGAAGGDWGIRGYVLALDANTGRERWRFYTVPVGDEPGADSWPRPDTAPHGGGAMWTTYTLDPQTGELFVPTGNPAPDYAPDWRPGANLYTDSLVVLDALTGKLKWYHQFESNDGLDYDFGAAPALYTSKTGADRIAAGSKDGYLYGLDRRSHKVLFQTAVTTIRHGSVRPTPDGVDACPGPLGGVEWNGPAVNPATHVIYVGAVDFCHRLASGTPDYQPGKLYFGTSQTAIGDASAARGWITAIDGDSGATLWKYHADAPIVAGVTPTAGGVVFSGDMSGNLLALDAKSGAVLYKFNTGGSIAGGVITYESNDRQYVASTSGNISRMTFSAAAGSPKVAIFALAPATDQPKIVKVVEEAPAVGATGAEHGKALFAQFCSGCHGASGEGSVGPRLQGESGRKTLEQAEAFIKEPKSPMPKLYPAPLAEQDVKDVAEFVESLK